VDPSIDHHCPYASFFLWVYWSHWSHPAYTHGCYQIGYDNNSTQLWWLILAAMAAEVVAVEVVAAEVVAVEVMSAEVKDMGCQQHQEVASICIENKCFVVFAESHYPRCNCITEVVGKPHYVQYSFP